MLGLVAFTLYLKVEHFGSSFFFLHHYMDIIKAEKLVLFLMKGKRYEHTIDEITDELLGNCVSYKKYIPQDPSKKTWYKPHHGSNKYNIMYDSEDLWQQMVRCSLLNERIQWHRYRSMTELMFYLYKPYEPPIQCTDNSKDESERLSLWDDDEEVRFYLYDESYEPPDQCTDDSENEPEWIDLWGDDYD